MAGEIQDAPLPDPATLLIGQMRAIAEMAHRDGMDLETFVAFAKGEFEGVLEERMADLQEAAPRFRSSECGMYITDTQTGREFESGHAGELLDLLNEVSVEKVPS